VCNGLSSADKVPFLKTKKTGTLNTMDVQITIFSRGWYKTNEESRDIY
jgi:hypothetical protein